MLKSMVFRVCSLGAVFIIAAGNSQVFAQSSFEDFKREIEEKFNSFKESKEKEFEDYRNRVNQEFAEYMRQGWDMHYANPAVPVPDIPEPPIPVFADPKEEPEDDILPLDHVIDIPDVPDAPTPFLPTPEPELDTIPELSDRPLVEIPSKPIEDGVTFDFYGSRYNIPIKKSLMPSLQRIDENSVADAWLRLSSDVTVDVIRQCVNLRDSLYLPDWGYFKLTEKIAGAAFPNDRNASKLLQMFLLTQSGYKVRIGRKDDHLVILMPSKETIYNYLFIAKNGIN